MTEELDAQMPLPEPATVADNPRSPASDTALGESGESSATPLAAPAGTNAPVAAVANSDTPADDGENGAVDATPKDTRPWMLCIIDGDLPRRLATDVAPLVVRKLRLMVCPTVTAGVRHIDQAMQAGEKVLAVMSEEPMAGMSGGGLWGLQKCKTIAPDAVRLLAVQTAEAVLKLSLDKLREAGVHQVFDVHIPPMQFVQRILQPMLAKPREVVDETLRSATVVAATNVSLLRIPKETFTNLLDQDAKLSIGITRELARRLRRQQQ